MGATMATTPLEKRVAREVIQRIGEREFSEVLYRNVVSDVMTHNRIFGAARGVCSRNVRGLVKQHFGHKKKAAHRPRRQRRVVLPRRLRTKKAFRELCEDLRNAEFWEDEMARRRQTNEDICPVD